MPPSPRSEESSGLPTEAAPPWQPPAAFDEYQLVRRLGQGRSGLVYLAHDTLLDRPVAIKLIPSVEDEALGRFLVEARAAARLQHPNVAALYRVGQLEGRPYLVSEFVEGTSLDRIVKPVAAEQAARIAVDLSRGLAAAHRRGVLHRDIKPGNAILAASGVAKLLDFGLAKLLHQPASSDPHWKSGESAAGDAPRLTASDEAALAELTQGQLVGTPYFMSPEAWRGEGLTERSDIYSLGALLYELVAGKGPYRDTPVDELATAVNQTEPRPVAAVAPGVPRALASVIDRAIAREPGERFHTADEMLAALELTRARRRAPTKVENPYRGLRPFESQHRAFFFGRERPLDRALERLRSEPLLVVTGDSGVGKSSFCAAAVIPAIVEGALDDGSTWALAQLVPGRSPTHALAQALAPLIGHDEEATHELLSREPESVGRAAARALDPRAGLLLYVDQLEELVTVSPHDEAEVAAEAIGSLASGLAAVRVLCTARSDFLSRLEALPGLRERVSRSLFLLAPLSSDEIREAIVGPAAVVGARFEDSLVDSLVDTTAAADGATPLLQFALAELWDRRDSAQALVRQETLEALGGVEGALALHADALLAVLSPAERKAARALLLRLVTPEGTRARRLEGELVALSPHAESLLATLVRGRLLVASETPDGTCYEIAHEALVTGWSTLAGWITEAAESRALLDRIETAASEWDHHERSRELLWNARQLLEVDAVASEDLAPLEAEFIAASSRGLRRRRWVRRIAVAVTLLAVAAAWLGARMKGQLERDEQIAGALERSERSRDAARLLADELGELRSAAFSAFDEGNGDEGERLWSQARKLRARARDRYGEAAEPLERALLLEPGRPDLRERYAELLYERAALAERTGLITERNEDVRRMKLYDADGELMQRWSAPAMIDVISDPPGATVTVRRYVSRDKRLVLDRGAAVGTTPITDLEVAPGSVVLEISKAGRPTVRLPLLARRSEVLTLDVSAPATSEMPAGFVWITAGRSFFGSDDPESVRDFFNAVPQHAVQTRGYFIARHETTYGDWIRFLDALAPKERQRRLPAVGSRDSTTGFIHLGKDARGRWRLEIKPGNRLMRAGRGEPIRYPQRHTNVEHDWLAMPVSGISFDDAEAYVAWLDRSGRVPGARLCSEREWERAARGADRRHFPTGFSLRPEDANIDETYGKRPETFGPDEVGRHPSGRSPFDVDDMAGNVWEWTRSVEGKPVARGGGFLYNATSARIANRQVTDRSYRDVTVGLRVCASKRS